MHKTPSLRPLVLALLACGSTASHAVSFTQNDVTLDINGTINGFYVAREAKSIDRATGAETSTTNSALTNGLLPGWINFVATTRTQGLDIKAHISFAPGINNNSDTVGLPIGNLSSQFFANVYLDVLDQHAKHTLRAKHYIRYVDDFIFLHESPDWLNQVLANVHGFLIGLLRVQLNHRKTILQPIERGVDFVGQVIKPWRRTTRRRTVAHALQRIEHTPTGQLLEVGNSYFGLLGQASHSHTDRAKLANALRRRGHSISASLIKAYRRPA